jgi:25S rRNA (cytosine2278-C5)-methyltransferase
LAKKGIALPATHGLRSSIERHKARLQAEFTKARIRRKLSTVEAFKAHVEQGLENSADTSEAPYPRWVRINTLKTTLEDQLDTTLAGLERVTAVEDVRYRGSRRLFIDGNIPNLVALSPSIDLSKSEAYRSGAIIFQDKASCFPAYLLDPLPEDGDIIDSCSAPGNKTTHIAAILLSHNLEPDECTQTIHAFEKNKGRAETLERMVNLAGSHPWTKLHPGHDFLKADPASPAHRNVGALLLDPSCSGSGIVGRDDMPELHLPVLKQGATQSKPQKKGNKCPEPSKDTRKRKREDDDINIMVDDDGEVTAVNTEDELKARLVALSDFQTQLLIHAFKFPAARKITYSTCSIHAEENEIVVQKALESAIAKEKGWRIQKRDDQIRGMKEWPVRGSLEDCDGDKELADACIRANKGDEHGTMGFFLAGFVRDLKAAANMDDEFLRDERGHLVRDLLGFPVRKEEEQAIGEIVEKEVEEQFVGEDEEWTGFGDDVEMAKDGFKEEVEPRRNAPQASKQSGNRHSHSQGKRPQLGIKRETKRRKG